MSDGKNKQTEAKRAAIVVLINLQREAQDNSSTELKARILKALEEGFKSVPWALVEDVIVVQE